MGEVRRRVVGTISMDSLAVELGEEEVGVEVTLIGDGVLAEEHARSRHDQLRDHLRSQPDRSRAERRIVDG